MANACFVTKDVRFVIKIGNDLQKAIEGWISFDLITHKTTQFAWAYDNLTTH